MDVVYICREGNNEELRYSIRSVVKNLKHDNIWVVGGIPGWYTGNHVRIRQSNTKYKNAVTNLTSICNNPEISDTFILMNDDFYIMNRVDDVPYMHGGLIEDKVVDHLFTQHDSYLRMLMQTDKTIIKKTGSPGVNYELHVPMIMNKKKLSSVLKLNGLWRSLYGNIYGVGGIKTQDVKVYGAQRNNRVSYDYRTSLGDYLSSNDDSFDILINDVLADVFPDKSQYEK